MLNKLRRLWASPPPLGTDPPFSGAALPAPFLPREGMPLPHGAPVPWERLSVLIVDDNVYLNDVFSIYFRRRGAFVESAFDGEEGLRKYLERAGNFDIVLFDIQMPALNGYEAARRIRASGLPGAWRVAIIGMSGNMGMDGSDHSVFDDVLHKPFDVDRLPDVVRRVYRA